MLQLCKRALNKASRVARRQLGRRPGAFRVGIIGAGEISATHIGAYEQSGLAHIVAISDPHPPALARGLDLAPKARAFRDTAQMLAEAKPDVVSICTWPQTHAELAAAAVAAGVRGILCEKPLALTLTDNQAIVDSCRRAGVPLAGGHQYRFHPYFVAAAAAIARGQLGELRRIRGQIGSSLANNGPHLFDAVRFLLEDREALSVSCRCDGSGAPLHRGLPAETAASGEVAFAGGVAFEFQTGSLATSGFQIVVEGTAGVMTLTPGELCWGNERRARPLSSLMAECRREQFAEFLRWVRGQRRGYAADGKQSLKSAELLLAAYEAARLGGPVALPLTNDGDVIRQLYGSVPAGGELSQADRDRVWGGSKSQAAVPADSRLAMDGGRRAVGKWFSSSPHIGFAELKETVRVIRSGQLNSVEGTAVARLQREFARAYGAPSAVASTSGTAAIHVAVAALDLEPGDEVITTPMSDMGSVIPILCCHLIPVFADIDPWTGNLTAESIADRITPRTRAVILVHLFGRPADLGPIRDLCRARGIALIEDCSQAHFAEYEGQRVGVFGDLGCFSLQQAKQITCGDGGITLVNRDDLLERAALFIDKGWNRTHGLRSHQFLGMNYRMTELQAAVASAQLRKLPLLMQRRRSSAERLAQALRTIPGIRMPDQPIGARSAWWKFNFAVHEEELGVSSDAFAEALQAEGVRISRQYLPRPLFEEEMLLQQRTFGRSRLPFASTDYRVPDPAEFPGLQEFFRRQLIMTWSSRATARHADQIARAATKIAAAASRHPSRFSHDLEFATTA